MPFFNNPSLDIPPQWAVHMVAQLVNIQKGITNIMAAVQVDQTQLDALAAALEAVKTSLAAEIANIHVALPEADLSGLNQALTDLQGLEAPAPTP